jgi:phospholipid/cholesterol/gamma-HCH transport system ATP-binding protein
LARTKISIANLTKSFDGKIALNAVNLEILENQSMVIIGGSGSGKSVMLKSIIGILEPDVGSKVIVDSINVTNTHIMDRDSSKFGMLFQGGALFDSLPIWHNVAFQLFNSGNINKKEARILAESKLNMVDISADVLDAYPAQLSGGMQKRVALARAIASNPEIIFFDEPTSGLDPINGRIVIDLIANLSKKLNATTITITHDIVCMKKIADTIAVLHDGQMIWSGPKEDINKTNNKYINSFIRASELYS